MKLPRRKPRTPEPATDPEPGRCIETTLAGERCQFPREEGREYCRLHPRKAGDSR